MSDTLQSHSRPVSAARRTTKLTANDEKQQEVFVYRKGKKYLSHPIQDFYKLLPEAGKLLLRANARQQSRPATAADSHTHPQQPAKENVNNEQREDGQVCLCGHTHAILLSPFTHSCTTHSLQTRAPVSTSLSFIAWQKAKQRWCCVHSRSLLSCYYLTHWVALLGLATKIHQLGTLVVCVQTSVCLWWFAIFVIIVIVTVEWSQLQTKNNKK